jgi:hypothetical protein
MTPKTPKLPTHELYISSHMDLRHQGEMDTEENLFMIELFCPKGGFFPDQEQNIPRNLKFQKYSRPGRV